MSGPDISSSAASQPSSSSSSQTGYGPREFDPESPRSDRLRFAAAELGMREEDLDVFLRNGSTLEQIPKNPLIRKMQLAYFKKHETPPPNWMVVSGLFPECEPAYKGEERRKHVRIIYRTAMLLIRRALKRAELDEIKGERSVFLDPVVEVCRDMEISQSKLSSFCKEFSGNSLTQTVDVVRAERVRKAMRNEIRGFVGKFKGPVTPSMNTCVDPLPEGEGLRKVQLWLAMILIGRNWTSGKFGRL